MDLLHLISLGIAAAMIALYPYPLVIGIEVFFAANSILALLESAFKREAAKK